jgi:hypothetical protein
MRHQEGGGGIFRPVDQTVQSHLAGCASPVSGVQARLVTDYYSHLPSEWVHLTPIPDHYAHVSRDNSTRIAFTESPTKGLQDIQTRMKPGKYLAKFYPDIPEPERNRLAMVIAKYDEFELNFAHTEDEIEHVYTTGPRSCMSHSAGDLAAPVHPSRVYASPDLAVAYIVRDDRITARAVCWPDKLRYSNIYGDRDRLGDELDELGYTQDSFDGARLLRIPVEAHRGVFVCPYIDSHANVRDDGEYLVIDDDDGDLCAQHTNGLTGEIGEECAHCEECHHPASMMHVRTSYHSYGTISLCESCFSDDAFECAGSHDYFTNAAENMVSMEDGRYGWHIEHFNQHGFECPHTGENYPTSDGIVDYEGTRWSQDAVDDDAVAMCGHSGEYYPTRDFSFLDTAQGILICDIELGRSHFTCAETDEIHPISEQAIDADGRLVHRRFTQEQAA